jgi:predicted small integral membrane protein
MERTSNRPRVKVQASVRTALRNEKSLIIADIILTIFRHHIISVTTMHTRRMTFRGDRHLLMDMAINIQSTTQPTTNTIILWSSIWRMESEMKVQEIFIRPSVNEKILVKKEDTRLFVSVLPTTCIRIMRWEGLHLLEVNIHLLGPLPRLAIC